MRYRVTPHPTVGVLLAHLVYGFDLLVLPNLDWRMQGLTALEEQMKYVQTIRAQVAARCQTIAE